MDVWRALGKDHDNHNPISKGSQVWSHYTEPASGHEVWTYYLTQGYPQVILFIVS